MRKVYWLLGLSLLWLSGARVQAADEDRSKKLENLLEIAVDRFQLNRYVEARAALERLLAENPSDEEAFKLRKIFGEKVLLEMQRYGNRPSLNAAERQALQLLGQATFAIERSNLAAAKSRLEEVAKNFLAADYDAEDFAVEYAQQLAEEVGALSADDPQGITAAAKKIQNWREQLQSVGNVPLVLLARAQRHEQDRLREPATVRRIINSAVASGEGAQRNLLEITRLGVYAAPELLVNLRNEKSDSRRTNAHFILLTLGKDVILPLLETLKSDDQLLVQQVCSILGEIRPLDQRAVPYLKAVYDNPTQKNLASTVNAAADALRTITGEDPRNLLPAADYFYREANRYYLGGDDVDRELSDAKNTVWVWDAESSDGKGNLQELPLPQFALADFLAEEATYRGLQLATDKTPYHVLLASIFLQQKNRVETLDKLLKSEDLSRPDTVKLRADVTEWSKRLERNQRIVFTLGAEHLLGVLEKSLRDKKVEVSIGAMDAIVTVTGAAGWSQLQNYTATGASGIGASGDGDEVALPVLLALADEDDEDDDEVSASDEDDLVVEVDAEDDDDEVALEVAEEAAADTTDDSEIIGAEVKETPAAATASSFKPNFLSHPLLQALDDKNPRVAITAANTLLAIGLPTNHPAYKKLLPLLLNGAEENRANVVEVITAKEDLRARLAETLEAAQFLPLVARDGYAGYNLAVQYPPKDVILIDNRTDQFNTLRLQMELRDMSQTHILPLTIITTRDHVANIVEQFVEAEADAQAAKRHLTSAQAEQMLAEENGDFGSEDNEWRVVIRHNLNSESKGLFESLQSIMRQDQKRAVVIITQPNRAERQKLKESLLLRAERSLRPETLNEYANLRQKEKVLGDVFGVRVTYAPIFVDEEIAGYDTMKTVQALQIDPRTHAVPIGILANEAEKKELDADFEKFISDGLVEIVKRDANANELIDVVKKMGERNKLSAFNYARLLSNDIATRSATSLLALDVNAIGRSLTIDEQRGLYRVVSDEKRPVALRIAAAGALGHFSAAGVLQDLTTLFSNTDAKEVALRAEIMKAIGKIDTDNKELDFKLSALKNETAVEVQKAAAVALGPAAQSQAQLDLYMESLRPNDPLSLVRAAKTAAESTDKPAPTADEEEESDSEDDTAADTDETAASAEDEDEDTAW